MSYMNHTEFVPAAGIQELSEFEIDYVAGGPVLIPIAYAGIALSVAVLSAGTAWVQGVKAGYAINKK